jgi:hypothetical protein
VRSVVLRPLNVVILSYFSVFSLLLLFFQFLFLFIFLVFLVNFVIHSKWGVAFYYCD